MNLPIAVRVLTTAAAQTACGADFVKLLIPRLKGRSRRQVRSDTRNGVTKTGGDGCPFGALGASRHTAQPEIEHSDSSRRLASL